MLVAPTAMFADISIGSTIGRLLAQIGVAAYVEHGAVALIGERDADAEPY